jgi:protein tyrosine/serine phosphatase
VSGKLKLGLLMGTILLSGLIYYLSCYRIFQNFHVVDEGKFYRSAQLWPTEFHDVVSKYHIKTVINLRGTNPDAQWYVGEKKALDEMGVKLVDIAFSSHEVPRQDQLALYLKSLDESERPILIHCRSGADRSGEASAIYEMEFMGKSKEEALQQLSLRTLHVELFAPAKRFLIERYEGRNWVDKIYSPCQREYAPYYNQHDNCPHNDKTSS